MAMELIDKRRQEVIEGTLKFSCIVNVEADYAKRELIIVLTIPSPCYDLCDCERVNDKFEPKEGAKPIEWTDHDYYLRFKSEDDYKVFEKIYGEQLSKFEILDWFWRDMKEDELAKIIIDK